MLPRALKLPKRHSLFLLGPRGTGKSTLLRQTFAQNQTHWIDLLNPEEEERFALSPGELSAVVDNLENAKTHVVIDEIQKVPKLLDVVHSLIERTGKKFILTGSSARKLRRGAANLLGGRAFVYYLHPFSFLETKDKFDLTNALEFGQLPKVYSLRTAKEKTKFLQSYARTYLQEEIVAEQVVRKLLPFRRFLEVAAQSNGKIVNHASIARDVGVAETTVSEYFSVLEDTMIGFLLEPFHHSFRKRLSQRPKFYFFDTGVSRALARTLGLPLLPQTSAFGDAFEQFVINEAVRLGSYFQSEYRFTYLRTKDDAEIDLIVERPGKPLLCIEIKSTATVKENDLSAFSKLTLDLGDCEAVCLSNEKVSKRYGHVKVMPWAAGLKRYFT